MVTAYNDAAGRDTTAILGTELGGQTLEAGVYDSASGTFEITGTLTLDAQGNTDAVFIFQTASTLVSASNSAVLLTNGADPCNVFWQVGSSATLGTGTSFVGTIMALESITLATGATVDGRALARNGAVTNGHQHHHPSGVHHPAGGDAAGGDAWGPGGASCRGGGAGRWRVDGCCPAAR